MPSTSLPSFVPEEDAAKLLSPEQPTTDTQAFVSEQDASAFNPQPVEDDAPSADGFVSVDDIDKAGGAPVPEDGEPESPVTTFAREAKSRIIPATGGLAAGIAGAKLGAMLPGTLHTKAIGAIAGGLAGAIGGQKLLDKAQEFFVGKEEYKRQREKREEAAAVNPMASTLGAMTGDIPMMASGRGVGKAVTAAFPKVGEAAATVAKLGKKAPLAAVAKAKVPHIAENAVSFGAMTGGEVAKDDASTAKDIAGGVAKGAAQGAVLGMLPQAKSFLGRYATKPAADAAALAVSGAVYDKMVNGTPIDIDRIYNETGGSIPPFMIMAAAQGLLKHPATLNASMRREAQLRNYGVSPELAKRMTPEERQAAYDAISRNAKADDIAGATDNVKQAHAQVADKARFAFGLGKDASPDKIRESKMAYVRDVSSRIAGDVPIKVYDTEADLLVDHPEISDSPDYTSGKTSGMYIPNEKSIAIVLERMNSPNDIVSTVLHEGGGHAMLERVLTPEKRATMLANLGGRALATRRELETKYGVRSSVSAEEALAIVRENAGANPSAYQRAVALVRKELRKVVPNLKLSDSEIDVFFRDAQNAVMGEGKAFTDRSTPIREERVNARVREATNPEPQMLEESAAISERDAAVADYAAKVEREARAREERSAELGSLEGFESQVEGEYERPMKEVESEQRDKSAREALERAGIAVPSETKAEPPKPAIEPNAGAPEPEVKLQKDYILSVRAILVTDLIRNGMPEDEARALVEDAISAKDESTFKRRMANLNEGGASSHGLGLLRNWRNEQTAKDETNSKPDSSAKPAEEPVARAPEPVVEPAAKESTISPVEQSKDVVDSESPVAEQLARPAVETPPVVDAAVAPKETVEAQKKAKRTEKGTLPKVTAREQKATEEAKTAENAPSGNADAASKPPELMTPEEAVERVWPPNKFTRNALPDGTAKLQGRVAVKKQGVWYFDTSDGSKRPWQYVSEPKTTASLDHQLIIQTAIDGHKPVNATSVVLYDIELPSGYVRDGDRYVFKPKPANTKETKVAASKETKAPELMTPEEYAITHWVDQGSGLFKGSKWWVHNDFNFEVGGPFDTRKEAEQDAIAYLNRINKPGREGGASNLHSGFFSEALDARRSVNAAAVDSYGIELPKGYVRDGELYVFKPNDTALKPAEPSVVPAPELTPDEFVRREVDNGPYADALSELSDAEREGMRKDALERYASAIYDYDGELSIRVADGIYEKFGGERAHQLLRHALAAGRINNGQYLPPDMRDSSLSYRQYLGRLNKDGVKPPNIAELYRKMMQRAASNRFPLSADGVVDAKMTVPEGYVRDGDVYEYRPTDVSETAPKPDASAERVDSSAKNVHEKGTPSSEKERQVPSESSASMPKVAKRENGRYYVLKPIDGKETWVVAKDAMPVKLEDAPEGVKFFAYKNVSEDGKVNGWSIVETRSGRRVGQGATRKEAMETANRQVRNAGPEQLSAMIDAYLKSAPSRPDDAKFRTAGRNPQEDTPEFKAWFGDSKVVDKDGKPRVMYHGTGRDITAFRPQQAGAIFLTDEPFFAQVYAETSDKWMRRRGEHGGANIMPVYVKAERPFDYDRADDVAALRAKLYDLGLWQTLDDVEAKLHDGDNWTFIESGPVQEAIKAAGFDSFYVSEVGVKNLGVYRPEQIKSASGNVGTFDQTNPDIRFRTERGEQSAEASQNQQDIMRQNRVRALPSTQQGPVREFQAMTEQAYDEGRSPRARAEIEARAVANRVQDKTRSDMRLLSGEFNSDSPEQIAESKLALNEMSERAISSGDKQAWINGVQAAYQFFSKTTRVGQALAMLRDYNDTPEARREWMNRLLMNPDDSAKSKIRDMRSEMQRAEFYKDQAEQGLKLYEHLKKTKVPYQGGEVSLDYRTWTPEMLMDNALVQRAFNEISTRKVGRLGRMVSEWYRNSVLSGPATQVINVLGNTGHAGLVLGPQRLAEIAIGRLIGAEGAPTAASTRVLFRALGGSVTKALANAREKWQTESPLDTTKLDTQAVYIPSKNVELFGKSFQVGGRQIRWPQRLMAAADEFYKTLMMDAFVLDHATRDYDAMMKKSPTEFPEEGRDAYLAASMDRNSRAYEKAERDVKEILFQQEGGNVSNYLARLTSQPGLQGVLTSLVFPFVRTPVNIVSTGMRKSPFGALRVLYKAAAGEYRGGGEARDALAKDLAEQTVALGTYATVYSLLAEDENDALGRPLITGTKTAERREGLREAEREDMPPMSVRIGDKWISYSRLEPFATMLSTMVDVMQAWKEHKSGRDGDIPMEMFNTVKNNVVDKTFLFNFGNLVRILTDQDEDRMTRFVSGTAAGFVPNAVRSFLRAHDPYVRDLRVREKGGAEWLQTSAKRLGQMAWPSEANAPIPRVSVSGEPVAKETGALYNYTIPFQVQSAEKMTKVDAMLRRYNESVDNEDRWMPAAPKMPKIMIGGMKDPVPLTDKEFKEFQEIRGRTASKRLSMMRFNYESPTERDVERVKKVYSDAYDFAKGRIRSAVSKRVSEERKSAAKT